MGMVCPLREFSEPLAFGGGDCAFRASGFSDNAGGEGPEGPEGPSEVCTLRFADGNVDDVGAFFLDLPNKNDMVVSKQRTEG